jgi:hypothetical protein
VEAGRGIINALLISLGKKVVFFFSPHSGIRTIFTHDPGACEAIRSIPALAPCIVLIVPHRLEVLVVSIVSAGQ